MNFSLHPDSAKQEQRYARLHFGRHSRPSGCNMSLNAIETSRASSSPRAAPASNLETCFHITLCGIRPANASRSTPVHRRASRVSYLGITIGRGSGRDQSERLRMTPPRPGWEARVNRWLEGRPPIDRGVSGQSWRTRLASSKTTSKLLCRQSSWMTEKDVIEFAEQSRRMAERSRAAGLVRKESCGI